ncbi:DUF4377 domain-containing protein [Acinetobacter sp. 1125_18A]|uniref:DUF4377 domain-containing protein n=1 Tax=Acinetobacter sp. 1125_18A TaxID=2605959 RepID=UPI0040582BF2
MNHKLSVALILPLLVMACSQESTTQKVPTTPTPIETQVSNTATQPQIIFLEVSPETRPCTGVAPQTCLLVRELTLSETGQKNYSEKEASYFYDSIDGFTHNSKSTQIIKVKRTEIANPAADQSQYQYELDSIVETIPSK